MFSNVAQVQSEHMVSFTSNQETDREKAVTYTVHIPVISKPFPIPVMNPIQNDGGNNYRVSWTNLGPNFDYHLQRTEDSSFIFNSFFPDTENHFWDIRDWDYGTFLYRVRAGNEYGVTPNSNIEKVVITHLTIDDFEERYNQKLWIGDIRKAAYSHG